jgi:cystathionine gamma-synthase
LSVELHSEAAAKALPGKLLLFGDATSLGGVESLVEWRRKYAHPALQLN